MTSYTFTTTTTIDLSDIAASVAEGLHIDYFDVDFSALEDLLAELRASDDPAAELAELAATVPSREGERPAHEDARTTLVLRRIEAVLADTPDDAVDYTVIDVERIDGDEGCRGAVLVLIDGDHLLIDDARITREKAAALLAAAEHIPAMQAAGLTVRWESWHDEAGMIDLLENGVLHIVRRFVGDGS